MQKNSLLRTRTFSPLLILLLFFTGSHHVYAQYGVTPADIAKMESVSGVSLSEDGNYIAYTLNTPADPYLENLPNQNHLYVLDLSDGTTRAYFTHGSVSSVDFRPGTHTVSFLTQAGNGASQALYEIPLDGGQAEKIFEFDRSILSYTWHHDGNHIFFTAFDEPESSASPLPYTPQVFEENQPQRRGYITNISRENHPPHPIEIPGSIYLAEWSPDGSQIALSVAPTSSVDDSYMSQEVVILDYRTRSVIAEINNQGKLGQIAWSPNGARLALRAAATIHDPIDGRIHIVTSRGGTPQMIDTGFEGKYERISWLDDTTLQFLASESTASLLGTLPIDGSPRQIQFHGDAHAISTYSLNSAGDIAFIASTPSHPAELFLLRSGESQPERMTFHNPWLDSADLGRQEVISYSTRDGEYMIDGIIIYPTGYEQGTPVPLITVVHGGPEAHYSNGWLTSYSTPGQMAAAKGYAVFYPNYRGSTGRGTGFAFSSQADMAGKEFDDIVDGTDHLIGMGIADQNRIGVTGGSYGGYASAWMSTYYSDRFAAAVMFVGISNNLSKWGTSDIPDELYLVHARERMWSSDAKWMDYLRRSPVYWVDRAQTPILIMHGSEDTRVHPGHSLELYRHLKVRKPNLPVRLVWYPGEGHGNRRSSARLDYSLRMMEWFDTYLMTGDPSADLPHWDSPVPEKE